MKSFENGQSGEFGPFSKYLPVGFNLRIIPRRVFLFKYPSSSYFSEGAETRRHLRVNDVQHVRPEGEIGRGQKQKVPHRCGERNGNVT